MSPRRIDLRGAAAALVRRLRTWPQPTLLFLSSCDGRVERLVDAFEGWCADHRGAVCDLALSTQWVRAVVAPAAAGVMAPDDLRRYAERQLAHYFGDSRSPRAIEWRLAVSASEKAPLVLAVPEALMLALANAARLHQVRIDRVAPWWLGACTTRAGTSQTLYAREPDFTTTIQVVDGRVNRLSLDSADPSEEDAREASGPPSRDFDLSNAGKPLPAVCDDRAVIDAIAATLRRRPLPTLDMVKPRIRPWRLSWALLLVSVLVAVLGEQHHDDLLDRQADAQAALIRAQARRAPAKRGDGEPGPKISDATTVAADADAMQAALSILALRQHPWADVFAGLDSASRSVSMLEFDHDARRNSVDLVLQLPDDDSAWAFAQQLASDTSRFSEASLVSRESEASPSGAPSTRVHVRATLKVASPLEEVAR